MTTITCKIPDGLNARLDALARSRRVPKSEIIREALEARMRRSRTRALTAYDLVKDLCGSVHGPRDLSTNPRYMEGFGA